MKKIIKTLFSDKIIRLDLVVSTILLFGTLLFIIISYRKLPPFLPLFNQMPWGDQRLGQRIEVFIPLLLATTIFIANTIFSYYLYQKMPLVSRMLSITSFIISLFTAIFLLRISMLVL